MKRWWRRRRDFLRLQGGVGRYVGSLGCGIVYKRNGNKIKVLARHTAGLAALSFVISSMTGMEHRVELGRGSNVGLPKE